MLFDWGSQQKTTSVRLEKEHLCVAMAEPARKVIATVTCGAVTLKLTLTAKVLAKSLRDGCITPFLGAFNKKNPGDAPLTADALARVEMVRRGP